MARLSGNRPAAAGRPWCDLSRGATLTNICTRIGRMCSLCADHPSDAIGSIPPPTGGVAAGGGRGSRARKNTATPSVVPPRTNSPAKVASTQPNLIVALRSARGPPRFRRLAYSRTSPPDSLPPAAARISFRSPSKIRPNHSEQHERFVVAVLMAPRHEAFPWLVNCSGTIYSLKFIQLTERRLHSEQSPHASKKWRNVALIRVFSSIRALV